MAPMYYRGTEGMIFVYNLSKLEDFSNIDTFIQEANRHADPKICVILVGNKLHVEEHREVGIDISLISSSPPQISHRSRMTRGDPKQICMGCNFLKLPRMMGQMLTFYLKQWLP
jgi:GTPase SAR1 family protein